MGRPTDVYSGRVSLSIFCSFITLELRGKKKAEIWVFFLMISFLAALVGMWEILVPQPGIEPAPPEV